MRPDLSTERLVLRELAPEHADALQALQDARSDDGGASASPAASEAAEDAAKRIANYARYSGPDAARRLVVYAAFHGGTLVGTVSLMWSTHPAIAAIGLVVGDAYQRQGFATELARRIVALGFDDYALNRIEADVEINNVASQRVTERAGMLREGVMRDCTYARGRWWTDARYAILARDFRAARAAM
jgi:RimJ/RimL family protein N-acetyltransferase